MPSRIYALFEMAKERGRTVRELLTGQPGPLLNVEVTLTNTFNRATKRFEQQNTPRGKKGRR